MNRLNAAFIKKILSHGTFTFSINGNSMKPVLFPGDKVKITACRDYRAGDIVLYESGTQLIVHRIMDMRGETVITKGDYNQGFDYAVQKSAILGKLVEPDVGHTPEAPRKRAAPVFNFWNEAVYNECKPYRETLGVEMTALGDHFFEDGKNIALSVTSLTSILDMEKSAPEDKLYIHIGVPITDHPCEGFVHQDRFDGVYRSGTYTSPYLLTPKENFLVLYGELMEYWKPERQGTHRSKQ
jgi:signal peptidase I